MSRSYDCICFSCTIVYGLLHLYQIIGSSLLFLFDSAGEAGVWMIDFAKSSLVEGKKLTHRDPWVLGNGEDGYLVGLDNLISVSFSHHGKEFVATD